MIRILSDMKLLYKSIIPIGLLTLTLCVVVWDVWTSIAQLRGVTAEIVDRYAPRRANLLTVLSELNEASLLEKNVALTTDPDAIKRYQQRHEASIAAAFNSIDVLARIADTPDWTTRVGDIRTGILDFKALAGKSIALALGGDPSAAAEISKKELSAQRASIGKLVRADVEFVSKELAEAKAHSESLGESAVTHLFIVSGAGISLSLLLGTMIIVIFIVRPIAKVARTTQAVVDGDLSAETGIPPRADEIGALANALVDFREKFLLQRKQENEIAGLRNASEAEATRILFEMCETLESDVESTVVEVLQQSQEAVKSGELAQADGQAIASESVTVAVAAEQASENVSSISAATEELSATGREIARRASQSADSARKAVFEVEQAGSTISALSSSADQIGVVVKLISEVAAQTNLLALNATIEAARAGEAGRGFAVVATEVKALARKTTDAVGDISERVKQINSATGLSVEALQKIGAAVREINEMSAGMAAAAEEQEVTLREVARSLSEASAGVCSVASSVSAISSRAERVEVQSRTVAKVVNSTDRKIGDLRASLIVSLRSSSGDRRSRGNRIPVKLSGSLRYDRGTCRGSIIDISAGGLLFRIDGSDTGPAEGSPATIDVEKIGSFAASVIAKGAAGIHFQFEEMPGDVEGRLAAFIQSVEEADQKFISAAKKAADQVAHAFAQEIARSGISVGDLFDTSYRAVPDTNPPQHVSRSAELCDRVLPAIQEPLLELDPRVVFCAAVDRNGYLPTHNRKFSQPQRPNDPAWNTANSRNRRIFNDRAGLRAARTSKEYLLQTYDREMGDGVVVTLKEIDVPVRVQGRHWGAVRLAFRA